MMIEVYFVVILAIISNPCLHQSVTSLLSVFGVKQKFTIYEDFLSPPPLKMEGWLGCVCLYVLGCAYVCVMGPKIGLHLERYIIYNFETKTRVIIPKQKWMKK